MRNFSILILLFLSLSIVSCDKSNKTDSVNKTDTNNKTDSGNKNDLTYKIDSTDNNGPLKNTLSLGNEKTKVVAAPQCANGIIKYFEAQKRGKIRLRITLKNLEDNVANETIEVNLNNGGTYISGNYMAIVSVEIQNESLSYQDASQSSVTRLITVKDAKIFHVYKDYVNLCPMGGDNFIRQMDIKDAQ